MRVGPGWRKGCPAAEAATAGVGVLVKKALGSGHLPAEEALRFALGNPGVSSVVVGSLSLAHLRENVAAAGRGGRGAGGP